MGGNTEARSSVEIQSGRTDQGTGWDMERSVLETNAG